MGDANDNAGDDGRQEWSDRAAAWRRWAVPWAAQTRAATELIVDAVQVAPGARLIDLASGPGEPALTLAERAGPRGHVVATDVVPALLAACHDAADERGLTNLSCVVTAAQQLPFSSVSFDALTCRFGIAHVPDYRRALIEGRRVLRPGGRAAFVVWGPRDQNPHFTLVDEVLAAYPAVPATGARGPGPFTFAATGSLSRILSAAGFRAVDEQAHPITLRWPGGVADYWAARQEMSGSLTTVLAALPAAERDRIAAAIGERLRPYAHEGTVALPALVIVAVATA